MVPNLSDNGKMDVVLTINMVCPERDNVIGVAASVGWLSAQAHRIAIPQLTALV